MAENTINKGFFKSVYELATNTASLLNDRVADTMEKARSGGTYPIQRISVTDNLEMSQQQEEYIERFTYLNFDTLSLMAKRDAIVAAIIARRVNQIAKFARPAHNKYKTGYKIQLKGGVQPTTKQEEQIIFIEEFMLNTGVLEDRPLETWMNFEEFLRRETYDAMVFDQISVERIPAANDTLHSFYPIDSSTIRFAKTPRSKDLADLNSIGTTTTSIDYNKEQERLAEMEKRHEDDEVEDIKYVQVVNGKIITQYDAKDLVFKMFNPTNDIKLNGYSMGPLEKLVNIITSHMFAEAHNRFYFTQGFSTRGILVIKGNPPQHEIDAFKRQWYAQVSGAPNSWRTPIIGGDEIDINWVPLQVSNRDMEWQAWMQYLVKVICALYLIAPTEIGWGSEAGEGMISSDSGRRNEVMLTESKDVGLHPILRFFEDTINREVVPFIHPEFGELFEFKFVGLDEDSPIEETDLFVRQLGNYKTLDEIRIEAKLKPLGEPFGMMILNPVLMPFYEAMLFGPPEADAKAGKKGATAKDKAGKTKKVKDKEKGAKRKPSKKKQ